MNGEQVIAFILVTLALARRALSFVVGDSLAASTGWFLKAFKAADCGVVSIALNVMCDSLKVLQANCANDLRWFKALSARPKMHQFDWFDYIRAFSVRDQCGICAATQIVQRINAILGNSILMCILPPPPTATTRDKQNWGHFWMTSGWPWMSCWHPQSRRALRIRAHLHVRLGCSFLSIPRLDQMPWSCWCQEIILGGSTERRSSIEALWFGSDSVLKALWVRMSHFDIWRTQLQASTYYWSSFSRFLTRCHPHLLYFCSPNLC